MYYNKTSLHVRIQRDIFSRSLHEYKKYAISNEMQEH